MSKGPIQQRRTPLTQPEVGSTRKGQKRRLLGKEFDGTQVNAELDYLHERLNQIVVEDPALTDLAGAATLAQVIARVNSLTETLRSAGLLREE